MTTSPKTVREVTRTAVRLIAEDVANKLLVGAAMDEHGISKDDVEVWNDIYDGVLGMIGTALKPLTQPDEQPQDDGDVRAVAAFLTHFREDPDDGVLDEYNGDALTIGMLRRMVAALEARDAKAEG